MSAPGRRAFGDERPGARSMTAHRYQLLIFDWDGTLADSESLIVASMQNAIRDLDLPARDDAEIGQLIGLGLEEGMQRLFPERDTAALTRLLMSYRKGFVADGQREAPLFAGAQAALQRLAADGHRLAVATGKSRAGLDRSLRAHRDLAALFATASDDALEVIELVHTQIHTEVLPGTTD